MKSSHIHKLKRHTYKTGARSFFCVLPDCNYRVAVEMSLGKRSLCWRCGEEFILNEYSIRLARPHCHKCHKRKSDVNVTRTTGISDLREKLLKTVESAAAVAHDKDRDI